MTPFNTEPTSLVEDMIPDDFICPITQEIITDPLMSRSGISFERSAILTWISEHNNTCPLTRNTLKASDLVPNHALKLRIQCWCEVNGYQLKSMNEEESVFVTCSVADVKDRKKSLKTTPRVSSLNRPSRARRPLSFLRMRS